MADLATHYATLVVRFRPDLLVIHEGDNDLAAGRTVRQILGATRTVLERTHSELPGTRVVLISAKPSPSRWGRAADYRLLNAGYRNLAAGPGGRVDVRFADLWPALLTRSGVPDAALYDVDGLHLDGEGYQRWGQVLARRAFQPPEPTTQQG